MAIVSALKGRPFQGGLSILMQKFKKKIRNKIENKEKLISLDVSCVFNAFDRSLDIH